MACQDPPDLLVINKLGLTSIESFLGERGCLFLLLYCCETRCFVITEKWSHFQDETVEMEGKDPRDQEDLRDRKVSVASIIMEMFIDFFCILLLRNKSFCSWLFRQ